MSSLSALMLRQAQHEGSFSATWDLILNLSKDEASGSAADYRFITLSDSPAALRTKSSGPEKSKLL